MLHTEPSSQTCPVEPDPAAPLASLLARARRDRRLLSVLCELTHRCNLRCRHCFLAVAAPDDAPLACQELDTGAALAVVDELAALGVLYVTFSGGEPLVRADFFDLAAHVRRRRLALRVYTNGTLLTAPAAARLAALHPLAVEISVYAAEPATHDAITGVPGSSAATMVALRRLHALGVRTVCKTPLMAVNAGQVAALATLAEEVGARFQPDTVLTRAWQARIRKRHAPLGLAYERRPVGGSYPRHACAAVRERVPSGCDSHSAARTRNFCRQHLCRRLLRRHSYRAGSRQLCTR